MAEEKKIILTNDGLKKLEEELENLKVVRRKEVAAKIKEARSRATFPKMLNMTLLRKNRRKSKQELLRLKKCSEMLKLLMKMSLTQVR